MKITEEGNRMVLKDSNFTAFLAGIAFIPLGIAIALFLSKGSVVIMAAGGLFVLVGAGLLLTTKTIAISLEKAGKCTFSSSSLLGKEFTECNPQQITGVWLEKQVKVSQTRSKHRGLSTHIRYEYYLNFAVDTGKNLSFKFDSLGSTAIMNPSNEQEIVKRAESVANFLGVPLKVSQPPGAIQTSMDPYSGQM